MNLSTVMLHIIKLLDCESQVSQPANTVRGDHKLLSAGATFAKSVNCGLMLAGCLFMYTVKQNSALFTC